MATHIHFFNVYIFHISVYLIFNVFTLLTFTQSASNLSLPYITIPFLMLLRSLYFLHKIPNYAFSKTCRRSNIVLTTEWYKSKTCHRNNTVLTTERCVLLFQPGIALHTDGVTLSTNQPLLPACVHYKLTLELTTKQSFFCKESNCNMTRNEHLNNMSNQLGDNDIFLEHV